MKTLRQIAEILNSDPTPNVRSLAGLVHLQTPMSLRQLLDRGSYKMEQAIRDKWAETGWETGPLGRPATETISLSKGFIKYNDFEHGTIYWVNIEHLEGTRMILDPVAAAFKNVRTLAGSIDSCVPTSDTAKTKNNPVLSANGLYNEWMLLQWLNDQRPNVSSSIPNVGAYYWSESTGVHAIYNFYEQWKGHGGIDGMGYPVEETKIIPGKKWTDANGTYSTDAFCQRFQRGTISLYWDWWTHYPQASWIQKFYTAWGGVDPLPPEYYEHINGPQPGPGPGPQPGTATLHLAAGPTELLLMQIRLVSVHWTVTPLWNPSHPVSIDATIANNTATGIWQVAVPTSGERRASVEISGQFIAEGEIEGAIFPGDVKRTQTNTAVTDMAGVTDRNISWLAQWYANQNTLDIDVTFVVTN